MAIEWWIVLATLAGPVVAVQTQKFIERATENRRRKLMIFTALMANRATRLNDDFVKALNLIDIEFLPRGWAAEKNRAVINAWRTLFGELHNPPPSDNDPPANAVWSQRCEDRLVLMLQAMSKALDFSFTEEELRRGIYYPRARFEQEQVQMGILHGARSVLEGRTALQMRVVEVPIDPDLAATQKALIQNMVRSYSDDGELRIQIKGGDVLE